MAELGEYSVGVHLFPAGSADSSLFCADLEELSALAAAIEHQATLDRGLYREALLGVFSGVTKDFTLNGVEIVAAHLDSLSMQMMAALTDFKKEMCESISKILAHELIQEKRSCSTALISKVDAMLQNISWSNQIVLSVSPLQFDAVKAKHSKDSQVDVVADSGLQLGNFRIQIGKTSITYDLAKDVNKLAEDLHEKLLQYNGD